MTIDKTIFGLRFGSSEEIAPARSDLDAFLDSRKKERSPELHGDDLVAYREMLDHFAAYEDRQLHAIGRQDFREQIFYGAVGHSCFFNTSLKLAVEQFKYHAHAYAQLDLRKPAVFIQSAEEEIASLSANRKDDAARLARLRDMVEERRNTLAALRKNRELLFEELAGILGYVADNLTKIKILTEASITVLAEIETSNSEASRLIDDIKAHFKEQLKDELRNGPVTRERLEEAKRDADALARGVEAIVHEDIASLTRLYTAIHEHVAKYAGELSALAETIAAVPENSVEEGKTLFARAELLLVALVSDYQFPVKTAVIPADSPHRDILAEKRKDMIDRVFDRLRRDRRSRHERRSGNDRRILSDPELRMPNRRISKDRRLEQRRD